MKLKLKAIADKAKLSKERLTIRVLADCDIGDFVLFRTASKEGAVTTDVRNTYWFPDKKVGVGDIVVVYSKAGQDSDRLMENGKRVHFFYWDQSSALWEGPNVAPVLLYCTEWATSSVDEL